MDSPLSFSGYKRFIDCPQYYRYHDVEKDRPGRDSSALLFGSMMDDVINGLLLDPEFDTKKEVSRIVASHIEKDIEFFDVDFDSEILSEEQIAGLTSHARSLGWKGNDFPGMVKDMFKVQDSLSENQRAVLRAACWLCMEIKANLSVDAYKKWILPKFREIHTVQKNISVTLPNGTLRGVLDFTATLADGRKVLFDNKTSKYSYEEGAALLSPQLALYAYAEGYEYAGFVVINKTVSKNKIKTCQKCGVAVKGGKLKTCAETKDGTRCGGDFNIRTNPSVYVQFQVEKIPKVNKDLIIKAMTDTITCIDNGVFPRNLTNCNNRFGKPCVYFKKCWEAK